MPSATADAVPNIERQLAYRIRQQEKQAVSRDADAEITREVIETADSLILEALNVLYDTKDPDRIRSARLLLIQAHTDLYVAARRERVNSDA